MKVSAQERRELKQNGGRIFCSDINCLGLYRDIILLSAVTDRSSLLVSTALNIFTKGICKAETYILI